MDKFPLFAVLLSVFVCWVHAKLEIVDLIVPPWIDYTENATVILDCNYKYEGVKWSELEVKWYHNDDVHPIYQWVPVSNKSGEPIGPYKYHVEVGYSPPDSDEFTMYRAMKLKNLTTELTGNYTCKISNLMDEDKQTKQLILYSPPQSGINITILEDSKNVICSVEDVFPVPETSISVTTQNGEPVEFDMKDRTYTYVEDSDSGFYTISTELEFENLTSLEGLGPVTFMCNISIPGTNYSEVAYVEYDTGTSSAAIRYPLIFLSTLLVTLLLVVSK